MTTDTDYKNNPLHGVSLKQLLTEIVDHYGFDILYAYLNINCFNIKPSIDSSVKFLKKTDWAREKVEAFYLYQFKGLPRASAEQLAELQQSFERMRQAAAQGLDDLSEDLRFHHLLLKAGGNRLLGQMSKLLLALLRAAHDRMGRRPAVPDASMPWHAAVLSADRRDTHSP